MIRHEVLLAVATIVVAALAWALWRQRLAGRREQAEIATLLDAMEAGIVLYDAEDRFVLSNADFKSLYPTRAAAMKPGCSFEELLRAAVDADEVPEAVGRESAWIAERVAQRQAHRSGTQVFERRMVDGRWRRIFDQRLPDGRMLGFSIDVTELVERQRALDAARQEAEQAHRLLDQAIDAMPAAVEIYDRHDRLLRFNRRMLALYPHMVGQPMLGETFETLARRSLAQGQVPEAVGREAAWLAERLAQRGGSSEPRLQRAPDGSWVHIYETPMPGGGLVTVRLDATEIVRRREELEDAIEALPEGFALFDAEDRLVLCNQPYRLIYAQSAPAMQPGARFESIVRYGLERDQYPQAGASAAEREAWLAERVRRHRSPDGVAILQQLPGDRWLRIDERLTRAGGVAGVRTEVTELVRARAALERLSATDALTGLANRRRFDERLGEEVQRARRHGAPLALLLVDVDHFKRFNDRHGHPEGDRALTAVAAVLARQARRPGELVARYGGEEFALLLPQSDASSARAVAERCGKAMATLALPHGDSPTAPHLTLSIGAACWQAPQDSATLLARADAALYAAKAAGRARCVMDDDEVTT
jgi:diguanylate cyclase (GGDEF)-like protein